MRGQSSPWLWRRQAANVGVASAVVSLCVFAGAFITIVNESGSSEEAPGHAMGTVPDSLPDLPRESAPPPDDLVGDCLAAVDAELPVSCPLDG